MVLSWWARQATGIQTATLPLSLLQLYISLTKDDMSFKKYFYIIIFAPELGLIVFTTCHDLALEKKRIAIERERVLESLNKKKKIALSAKCD